MRYLKIAPAALDTRVVNVTLSEQDGLAYGRVTGPAEIGLGEEGRGTPARGVGQDWVQAVLAVHQASRMAEELGTHVNVVDPDGLWHENWGVLEHGAG